MAVFALDLRPDWVTHEVDHHRVDVESGQKGGSHEEEPPEKTFLPTVLVHGAPKSVHRSRVAKLAQGLHRRHFVSVHSRHFVSAVCVRDANSSSDVICKGGASVWVRMARTHVRNLHHSDVGADQDAANFAHNLMSNV